MSDERIRSLERAAATGDEQAQAALLRERRRAGLVEQAPLWLWARSETGVRWHRVRAGERDVDTAQQFLEAGYARPPYVAAVCGADLVGRTATWNRDAGEECQSCERKNLRFVAGTGRYPRTRLWLNLDMIAWKLGLPPAPAPEVGLQREIAFWDVEAGA